MAIIKKQKDILVLLTKYRFYLDKDDLIYYRDIDKRYRLYLFKYFKTDIFKIIYNKNIYLRINKIYFQISKTLYFNKLYTHLKKFINSYYNY